MTSLTGCRWAPTAVSDARVARIAQHTGLSAVASRCLASRWDGDDLPDPKSWFTPAIGHLHDPYAMLNMEAAVDRLRHAARTSEKIRIITDYDVDGTTSSLILQAALRLLSPGVDIDYHIPNRFHEGYGFSVLAAQKAAADGVGLIVTADIGVRDHAAVQCARDAGIDVLICDHHLPAGASVPEGAIVLCPPQAGCDYPNPHLAACGVSLKLATALLGDHKKWDAILLSILKLGAVGTIADLVQLTTRENRAIVTLGLQELNRPHHHAGLAALLDVSGSIPGEIRTSDLGFRIGPRINAAGRVADASLVVRLLNCRDPEESKRLAAELNRLNEERRHIQRRVEKEALERVEGQVDPFVLVAGSEDDGWHRGVVGIVASRIKDEVHRPTAIVAIQGDTAVGSVRSIHGVHAVRALDSVSDLLVRYGGHPAAAGFTVPTEHLDALRERLGAYVLANTEADNLVRTRTFDAEISADDLGEGLFDELGGLGPFGMGNPTPRLVLRGVQGHDIRTMGKDKTHLKMRIKRRNSYPVDALWWGQAALADTLAAGPIDLLGQLGVNVWKGRRNLQFEIKDAQPA